jgi:hypothetical protein
MTKAFLLYCGVLAAILYVAADIGLSLTEASYSYLHQTVSELSAIGSPTRHLAVAPFLLHGLLQLGFGLGVWMAAAGRPELRTPARALTAVGILDVISTGFPMHARGMDFTLTDTMHILVTMTVVLMIVVALLSSRGMAGGLFRRYSDVSLAVILLFGAIGGMQAPRIAIGLDTPWLGVVERVCIYAYMLWMAAFANLLLGVPGGARRRSYEHSRAA